MSRAKFAGYCFTGFYGFCKEYVFPWLIPLLMVKSKSFNVDEVAEGLLNSNQIACPVCKTYEGWAEESVKA